MVPRPVTPLLSALLAVGSGGEELAPIRGRLMAHGGVPPAATIRLLPLGPSGETGPPVPVAVDGEGRFELAAEALPVLLEVMAPGFRRELRWLPAGGPTRLGIVLSPLPDDAGEAPPPPPSRVPVRAVDGTGVPIAGAEVTVTRLDLQHLAVSPVVVRTGTTTAHRAVTGPDGSVVLYLAGRIERPEADGAGLLALCRAPGRALGVATIRPLPDQDVTCRLAPDPVAITGTVRDPENRPVAGVPLTVLVPTEAGPLAMAAASDEDGGFDTGATLPPSPESWIVVNAPPYEPTAVRVTWPPPGHVLIPVRYGVPLEVEVVDALDGRPVRGARVVARILREPFLLLRPAAAEGDRYRLDGLPPGSLVEIVVKDRYHLPARITELVGADAGGLRHLRVELEPAGTVAGTVRDLAGRPIAGARLTAVGVSRRAAGSSAEADARGRYVIGGLVAGETYRLTCEAPGYAPWWQDAVVAHRRGSRLDVILGRGATVEGVVVHEGGEPGAW